MRRPILLTLTTILTITTILLLNTNAGAASYCANSFPDDGYAGPHWRSINGGTMYGNTLKVDCPTQQTAYDYTYMVQRSVNGGPFTVLFSVHKTGTGSIQTSFSASPIGCDPTNSTYRTRVKNNITFSAINKPGGGGAISLNC